MVAQAVVELADELVPDPAERLFVAVAEFASVLVERPGARGGVHRAERPVPAGVEQAGVTDAAHQHHSALPGRLGDRCGAGVVASAGHIGEPGPVVAELTQHPAGQHDTHPGQAPLTRPAWRLADFYDAAIDAAMP